LITMLAIDLKGRVALVTGGSGELGRCMVRTLARAGAQVALTYLNSAGPAEQVVQEVLKEGGQAKAFQADVTLESSVQALQTAVQAWSGAPHIIVSNAVIQYPWKSLLEQDLADYESQFRSCVLQSVLLAKSFSPAMIERRHGRIIGINTECSLQAFAGQSAYVSGKKGMDGLLRVLARELGPHQITVNQVAPGWTVSEKDRKAGTEDNADYSRSVPLKRRGTDEEVANVVAFLASDLSSFVTGAFIPVCGGNVMPAI
jgi:3-oxoacyl-[acyl-carrier protein] reductase